jgi:hypothetical protein
MMTRTAAILAASLTSVGAAAPRESVTFVNVDGNGVLDNPANAVRHHEFSGGYPLGRISLTGALRSVHSRTWASDAGVRLTAPGGGSVIVRPFPSLGRYFTADISAPAWLEPGIDPAGAWTARFFESFDDGGTASVDARWDLTITLSDDPPAPPAATNLGVIARPGLLVLPSPLPQEGFRWYRFEITSSIAPLNGHLDIDTFGSVIAARPGVSDNDTQMALYDARGTLVATDDDSCAGFLGQLSFGVGGRPPTLDGEPYDGQNGPLGRGVYFVAVGGYPLEFSPYWSVLVIGPRSGSTALRLAFGPPCRADYSNDGIVDFFDYLDFVAAFDSGSMDADFNGDQIVDFFDYLDFAAAFDNDC